MAEFIANSTKGLYIGHYFTRPNKKAPSIVLGALVDCQMQRLCRAGQQPCRAKCFRATSPPNAFLVPVVLWLVRPFDRHADVLRLLRGQLRELHAELREVQPGNFLIELLG